MRQGGPLPPLPPTPPSESTRSRRRSRCRRSRRRLQRGASSKHRPACCCHSATLPARPSLPTGAFPPRLGPACSHRPPHPSRLPSRRPTAEHSLSVQPFERRRPRSAARPLATGCTCSSAAHALCHLALLCGPALSSSATSFASPPLPLRPLPRCLSGGRSGGRGGGRQREPQRGARLGPPPLSEGPPAGRAACLHARRPQRRPLEQPALPSSSSVSTPRSTSARSRDSLVPLDNASTHTGSP